MLSPNNDKGSLNAFTTSLLKYGHDVFREEIRIDDTYRHARPYQLSMMSTRALWIVYLLFYGVLIASTIWSLTENSFSNDSKYINDPHAIFLNDTASLISHEYDPNNNGVFGNHNQTIMYFDTSSFYPYQLSVFLYSQFITHSDINLSDPFLISLLNGDYLFNLTVLLNITNNDNVLGFESKYVLNQNIECKSYTSSTSLSPQISCSPFSIWSPYDNAGFSASWQNILLKDYKNTPKASMIFNTSILFDINWSQYGNFSLEYVFENQDFVQFEFYVKLVLCGCTCIFLIFWICYGLRDSNNQKDLIAEQRWMIVLFFAVLLYQDPLTFGLAFSSDASFDALYLLSSIFFATSVHLFCCYWSLMIDSIREIQNLLEAFSTFGCKFYRGKLITVTISYISSLIFTICSQYAIENNTEKQSYNSYLSQHAENSLIMTILMSGIVWFFFVFIFLIWLLKSLWNANKELAKLPYIETRERYEVFVYII